MRAAVRGHRGGTWAGVAVVLAGGMLALTGCGVGERLLWGEEGYAVKEAARSVIDAVAAGEAPAVCDGVDVDFGEPDDWRGAGAGEPERIDGRWHINVEVREGVPRVGEPMPGDLVFGETPDGLCLQEHLPSIPVDVGPG
ncbi:hypothetical protein MIFL109517_07515 [Micrococcus flavus]